MRMLPVHKYLVITRNCILSLRVDTTTSVTGDDTSNVNITQFLYRVQLFLL